MRRACHVSTVHNGPDPRIFEKECRTLAEAGWETHLVIRDTDRIPESGGVRLHELNTPWGGRVGRFALSGWMAFRAARATNSDVYHFHDPEFLPWALLLRQTGARVIYDVHEDIAKDVLTKHWIAERLRPRAARVFARLENALAGRLDAIVTAVEGLNRRFRDLGPEIITINNYPDLRQFGSVPRGGRERMIVYAGTLSPTRGIAELVRAAARSDVRLAIAGRFNDPHYERQCRALPEWKHVQWEGYLSRKRLISLLSRAVAGAMVLNRSQYYQPTKLYEYWAAGLPVIATRFPQWLSLVEDQKAGICVDPWNIDEIAAAMRRLADSPAEARTLGENGRRLVETRYSWEKEAEKLLALYRRLAGANGSI